MTGTTHGNKKRNTLPEGQKYLKKTKKIERRKFVSWKEVLHAALWRRNSKD